MGLIIPILIAAGWTYAAIEFLIFYKSMWF